MRIFEQDSTTVIPFLADSHFGAKSFHKTIFGQMMLFFEEQFFPWCLKNGVKNVVHCGDFVHNRNIIDLWINQEIKSRFFKWFEDNGVNLHIIVGNHDSYYKNTIEYNYLSENTKEFSHVHVYQEQEKIKIGKYTFLMVPWIVNEHSFRFEDSADICVGHFEMSGFKMTSQMFSTGGLDVGIFDQFKAVFTGHYHIRSHRKNIYYVGSQYPITWNDYGEDQGFYVVEDGFKISYIDNKVNARFLKIYYDEINGEQNVSIGGIRKRNLLPVTLEDAIAYAKENYCKLITNHVANQSLLDAFYTSLTNVSRDGYKIEIIDSNEIVEGYDLTELEQQIQDEADIQTTVSTYLTSMTFEKDIDGDMLVKLFSELFKEASDKVIER